MEAYKNFKEFEANYEKDMKSKLFLETFRLIQVYRKPKNVFEKLFKSREKRYDSEASTYGYELNPVLEIQELCPMIGKVDIKWRSFDGEEYTSRVDVKNLYHY